jgi:hypothetical protein
MPAVTFTVTGPLMDYGNNPHVGVKVTAVGDPDLKVLAPSVHSNQLDGEGDTTDDQGNFMLTLVSAVGLWYLITAGRALNPVRIAAYIPDPGDPTTGTVFAPGTTFAIADLVDESPTPGYQGLVIAAPIVDGGGA